nr:reverse transcriptase [Ipomoea batatas]
MHTQGAPFQLQAAWLTDNRWKEVVRKSWRFNDFLTNNLNVASEALSLWNKNVFGHILKRKRTTLARLEEELMWFQRSREDWIVSGDRNTKYYHTAVMVRKTRNSVSRLKLATREWTTDNAQLKTHVRDYYISLFTDCSDLSQNTSLEGDFPLVTQADWGVFNRDVTKDESSFVPGRQISDNIIIYQEVMHTMRKKRGATGFMAIKLDFEKAYDRLSWDFIESVLRGIGFSDQWVRKAKPVDRIEGSFRRVERD